MFLLFITIFTTLSNACVVYDYDIFGPQSLTNNGGCPNGLPCYHQVIGRIYKKSGQCYKALTGCWGCLPSATSHPEALQPVSCDQCPEKPAGCAESTECQNGKICVSGKCQRDCNAFDFDGFLDVCSTKYPIDLTALSDAIADVKTDVTNAIFAAKQELNTARDALGKTGSDAREALGTRITTLSTTITNDINDRLDKIEEAINKLTTVDGLAARSQMSGIIGADGMDMNSLMSSQSKDTLLILLLILNMLLMVGGVLTCILLKKSRNVYYQRGVTKAYSSDDEEKLKINA